MAFKEALRTRDFVVSAELPLTPDSTRASIVDAAKSAGDSVDGFLLTDNQYGKAHMSPATAAAIMLEAGLSPILQLSCRNRNRIALIGELLGARALGVGAVMLVRGIVVPEDFNPRPKAVMDLGIRDLIATAKVINEDEKLGAADDLLIGASATVHRPMPEWQPEELLAKAEAGAQMIVTQLCLDTEILRRYMDALVATKLVRKLSVIISIAALSSADMAVWLRDNRRRAIVPPAIIERLRKADDAGQEGIEIGAELLRDVASIPGVSGVNFVAAGDLELVPKIVARSGILKPN